ncbi:MAG TPA: hypothetical protein VM425_03285 [Myxococcota bacterium]|nr:hypothetical protein [Myxococcota bacterium]
MRSALLIGLLCLVPATKILGAERPISARQTMYRLVKLLARQDLDKAKKLTISADEYASFSTRPVDRKDYQARLDGFLSHIARELAGGVEFTGAQAADALILPAGRKTKRELVMTVIRATFSLHGKQLPGQPMSFFFVNLEGSWKMFLRK